MKQTRRVPFDIEKAKQGAKVVTKDGNPVRIVSYDRKSLSGNFPICALIDVGEYEMDLFFREDGTRNDEIYNLFIEEEVEETSNKLEIRPDKWYTCIESWSSVDMKIGDWFEEGYYYLGSDILKYKGLLEEDEDYMDFFRPWDFNDAKDGDVLCYETKDEFRIFIYKNGHVYFHCHYYNGHLTVNSYFVIQKHLLCYVYPATKEQRDLLFQKMKEEGYYWDSDKKELHKIEEVKTRRMTNQELAWWLRDCPEEHREWRFDTCSSVYSEMDYSEDKEHNPVPDNIVIRKNGGEWQEPLIEE